VRLYVVNAASTVRFIAHQFLLWIIVCVCVCVMDKNDKDFSLLRCETLLLVEWRCERL